MAPPPPTSHPQHLEGCSSTTSSGGGLSKLIHPVQDLGRSLLGFLLGSQQPQNTATLPPEQTRHSGRETGAGGGRTRPIGHPANPTTPVVMRRGKGETRPFSRSVESSADVGLLPGVSGGKLPNNKPEEGEEERRGEGETLQPTVAPQRKKKPKKGVSDGDKITDTAPQTGSCSVGRTSSDQSVGRPDTSSRKHRGGSRQRQRKAAAARGAVKLPQGLTSEEVVDPEALSRDDVESDELGSGAGSPLTGQLDEFYSARNSLIVTEASAESIQSSPIQQILETKQLSSAINPDENKSCSADKVVETSCDNPNEIKLTSSDLSVNNECSDSLLDPENNVDTPNSSIIHQIEENCSESLDKLPEVSNLVLTLGSSEQQSQLLPLSLSEDNCVSSASRSTVPTSQTCIVPTDSLENTRLSCEISSPHTSPAPPVTSPFSLDTTLVSAVTTTSHLIPPQPSTSTDTCSLLPSTTSQPDPVTELPSTPAPTDTVDRANSPPSKPTPSNVTPGPPPPPPPPPPPGFLTEGLKLGRPGRDKTEVSVESNKSSPRGTATVRPKKEKRCGREQALLEQLSGFDDSFANFLKTQLNIQTGSRERGADSDLLGGSEGKRKSRRKRTDSECSQSSVGSTSKDCYEGRKRTISIKSESLAAEADIANIVLEEKEESPEKSSGADGTNLKTVSDQSDTIEEDKKKVKEAFDVLREKLPTENQSSKSCDKVEEEVVEASNEVEKDSTSAVTSPTCLKDSIQTADAKNSSSEEPALLSDDKSEPIAEGSADHSSIIIDTPALSEHSHETPIDKTGTDRTTTVDPVVDSQTVAQSFIDSSANVFPTADPVCKPVCTDTMGLVHSAEGVTSAGSISSSLNNSESHLSKSDSGYAGFVDRQQRICPRPAIPSGGNRGPSSSSQAAAHEVWYSDSEDESYDSDSSSKRGGLAGRDTRSYNSRRSSTDSSEDGLAGGGGVRELKNELRELEDKFKKAMVANASHDNEKCQLMFQVDLLKDQVEEVEEQNALIVKELRAKSHDYELLKRDHADSVRAVQLLQAALQEQQAMLQERGLVLMGGGEDGEEEDEVIGEEEQEKRTRAIVSQDTANVLAGLGPGPLDVRIKRLARQRDDLQDTNRRLKLDLEEERSRNNALGGAHTQAEIERETKKILEDFKFKISKVEQENATLQANVARLDSQVIRYKTAAESAELAEENLKVERRKTQRELRDAQTRAEELETANKHLEKRLEKLKTAKSNLLKEL